MTDTVNQEPAVSWQDFYGPNFGYVMELYDQYLSHPDSVDDASRRLFERLGAPSTFVATASPPADTPNTTMASAADQQVEQVVAAQRYARNIREYGHLEARTKPVGGTVQYVALLDPTTYALTEADLEGMEAKWVWTDPPVDIRNAQQAIVRLRELYMGTLAYEFRHIHDLDEQAWLASMVESGAMLVERTPEEQTATLKRLIEVEEFERFLHRTFVGQKRFSIEGLDMLVPMLEELIQVAAHAGAKSVMMGMAHRGRLNVLAHVLGKPYPVIFSEFHTSPNKELVPSEGSMGINYGWTGDVKYHLGASRTVGAGEVTQVRVVLANNPSHLEFVDPVVEGYARAAQDDRSKPGYPGQHPALSLAVQVHGDAAFPGEGVVAETLNLSHLDGYQTGGTIHIIANNQLGFTADESEGRSTHYASDLAKGFEIPIVHVCADDPEACLAAISLAHAYRAKFHKDFLIDLLGYRKWGHNEMDDPVMTQPQLYAKISTHRSVRELYASKLQTDGVITAQALAVMEEKVQATLQKAYTAVTEVDKDADRPSLPEASPFSSVTTAVPLSLLSEVNEDLLRYPEGFTAYPKLQRILERRRKALTGDGLVDWAHAEALAFATILAEGTPIRLSGQDSERGTFGQRHLVLHDFQTGEKYSPLHGVNQAKASFAVHNSPLSEAAVIGFEYGYNVEAPDTLVLWEAQFGDFANAGQVLIDQFLASGRAKWGQQSGLVLLLPHGYEGQGPEHSSARLERYLQSSAETNWRVANVTTSAQYFHLLRMQAATLATAPLPLVVMTPKSLLRNPKAASHADAFTQGSFQLLLDDPVTIRNQVKVERLVFCTGKVAVDLTAALEENADEAEWLAIVRMEQLYPFPEVQVEEVLGRYSLLDEVIWVQEEPMNMGAWSYINARLQPLLPEGIALRYVGRPERSSPAEGVATAHDTMQRQIIQQTLTKQAVQPMTYAGRNSL